MSQRVKGFYPEFQKQGSQSKQKFLAYGIVSLKFRKIIKRSSCGFDSNVALGGTIDGETVEGKIQICKGKVRGLIERN